MKVIPVVHNVSSVQRVVDSARLAFSLGYPALVVTKAYGGAAQSGVPEASKLALKSGRSLIVLPDLRDAIDLLQPDRVLLLTNDYAEKRVSPGEVALEGRLMVVVSGGEPECTPNELRLGEPVYIEGVERKIGAVAELAIILYSLKGAGHG